MHLHPFALLPSQRGQVQYYYYRIGLQLGLWVTFATVAGLDIVLAGLDLLAAQWQRKASAVQLRLVAGVLWDHGMRPFVETLVAATVLGACYAFATIVYWRIPIEYAWEKYVGGFMSDIFGVCAAGGFKEAWELECIPVRAG